MSGTCQAQKRLEQLPLLRQPQLRQRASARLLLEVLAQPPTLQADIQPLLLLLSCSNMTLLESTISITCI